MKYTIVRNGLWGTRALNREEFGGLSSQPIDLQQVAEAMERNTPERRIRFITSHEGRRQLEEALEREMTRQIEETPDIQYVDPIDNGGQMVVRQGTTNMQDIHYQRLQSGDISMLEYLDLMSDEV